MSDQPNEDQMPDHDDRVEGEDHEYDPPQGDDDLDDDDETPS